MGPGDCCGAYVPGACRVQALVRLFKALQQASCNSAHVSESITTLSVHGTAGGLKDPQEWRPLPC